VVPLRGCLVVVGGRNALVWAALRQAQLNAADIGSAMACAGMRRCFGNVTQSRAIFMGARARAPSSFTRVSRSTYSAVPCCGALHRIRDGKRLMHTATALYDDKAPPSQEFLDLAEALTDKDAEAQVAGEAEAEAEGAAESDDGQAAVELDAPPISLTEMAMPDLAGVAPITFAPRSKKVEPVMLEEAMQRLRAGSKREAETVDLCIRISTKDPTQKRSKTRNPIRGLVLIPHVFWAPKTIVVFAKDEQSQRATDAGATVVGGRELVPRILSGEIKADVVLADAGMLKELKPDARHLRALMPNVKKGTAGEDMKKLVEMNSRGLAYKSDKHGCINCAIGKVGLTDDQMRENINAILETVEEERLGDKKSAHIISALVSSNQQKGKGIPVILGDGASTLASDSATDDAEWTDSA